MAKNQQAIVKVESLRQQIADKQAERKALQAQTRSPAEVRVHVEKQVARWAEEATRQLRRDLTGAASGNPPELLEAFVNAGSPTIPATVTIAPILALMLGADMLKERILAHLDAVPECPDTPQRLARIEEIGRELDDLESEEERLICEAEERGEFILRRGDARPEIVLGEAEPVAPRVDPTKYLVSKSTAPQRAAPSPYVGSGR